MDRSPFGSLPVELRLEIYEHVLQQHHDIHLIDKKGSLVCANTVHVVQSCHLLAITETCNTIRSESLSIFYSCNSFFWNSTPDPAGIKGALVDKYTGDVELHVFKKWLRKIGPASATAISRLTFDMGFWSTLPMCVDVQETWWVAARRAASVLCDAGLPTVCDVRIQLTVERYRMHNPLMRTLCEQDQETYRPFDLILPTRSRKAAMAAVDNTMVGQGHRLLEQVLRGPCETADRVDTVDALKNLTYTHYMVLRAFGIGAEEFLPRAAKFWVYVPWVFYEMASWLSDNNLSYGEVQWDGSILYW